MHNIEHSVGKDAAVVKNLSVGFKKPIKIPKKSNKELVQRNSNNSINNGGTSANKKSCFRNIYSQSNSSRPRLGLNVFTNNGKLEKDSQFRTVSQKSIDDKDTKRRTSTCNTQNRTFNMSVFWHDGKQSSQKIKLAKFGREDGKFRHLKMEDGMKKNVNVYNDILKPKEFPYFTEQNSVDSEKEVFKNKISILSKISSSGTPRNLIQLKKTSQAVVSLLEKTEYNKVEKVEKLSSISKKPVTFNPNESSILKDPNDSIQKDFIRKSPACHLRSTKNMLKHLPRSINNNEEKQRSTDSGNRQIMTKFLKNKDDNVLGKWIDKMKQYFKSNMNSRRISDRIQEDFERYERMNQKMTLKTTLEFYKIEEKIIESVFSSVYLATQVLTGLPVALKKIPKETLKQNVKLHQEIFILKKIRNKSLLMRLLEVFEDEKYLYLILEYHPNGDLISYLNNRALLSEEELAPIYKKIVQSVKSLHEIGVIHRDIKMDNILLDRNCQPILSDFGISSVVKPDSVINDTGGTPAYLAPEVINANGEICYKTDVWGLGVLLYTLVFGVLPFQGSNFQELYKNILSESYKFPDHVVSKEVKDLIRKILKVKLNERYSIDEILEHEWLKKNTIEPSQSAKALLAETTYKLSQKKKDAILRYLNDVGFGMDFIYECISSDRMNHVTACYDNLRLSLDYLT